MCLFKIFLTSLFPKKREDNRISRRKSVAHDIALAQINS